VDGRRTTRAGSGSLADVVDEVVGAAFSDYGSHYASNPLFDPTAALAGYQEWARASIDRGAGGVLTLLRSGVPIGVATVAIGKAPLRTWRCFSRAWCPKHKVEATTRIFSPASRRKPLTPDWRQW